MMNEVHEKWLLLPFALKVQIALLEYRLYKDIWAQTIKEDFTYMYGQVPNNEEDTCTCTCKYAVVPLERVELDGSRDNS